MKTSCDTNGLTTAQAKELQEIHGKNTLADEKKESFFKRIFKTLTEPMFLLLIISSIIYFILGEPKDGADMLVFVTFVMAIDFLQELRTDKSLNALKSLSAPEATVIRDGKETEILSEDIVPGDIMLIHEGMKIPADGIILESSPITVDESTLTGETECVIKTPFRENSHITDYWRKDYCYAGTLAVQGSAKVKVTKIGNQTEYGKIGKSVNKAPVKKSPLQNQIDTLVKTCTIIAIVFCIITCILTWFTVNDATVSNKVIQSILAGITLAMAVIPEEFPVVLAVFLSMGAWRLSKKNALIRKLSGVETLGEISVLCVDKTGTLTENKMTVDKTWTLNESKDFLIKSSVSACESDPYDPMEKAIIKHCEETVGSFEPDPIYKTYPFTNETKIVGYARERKSGYRLYVKGSTESLMKISELSDGEKDVINKKIRIMSKKGLRVIAVGYRDYETEEELPETLTEKTINFLGLIALNDPLRKTVKRDIETLKKAGIRVVMITGDNGFTAAAIAKKAGIEYKNIINGNTIEKMTDTELQNAVKTTSVFSRVIPEHKMRIIKAFRENGEITAMIGDGVNDAAALKFADIGIAMGKKGSEVSREAADLILLDEKFSTVIETVKDGRRIYDNIKKAVGYIFSIHLPIMLSALIAPLLTITTDNLLLLPVHMVLLELLIDPTCSIVFERQPAEADIMTRNPRSKSEKILTKTLLIKSLLQGLGIFIFSFIPYLYLMTKNPLQTELARSFGIAVIIVANIFLVHVNSSETDSIFNNLKKLKKDKIMIIANAVTFLLLFLVLYSPLSQFLNLTALSLPQLILAVIFGIISVSWWEIVKLYKKAVAHSAQRNKVVI